MRKIINCFSKYNSRQKIKNEKAVENIYRFFLLLKGKNNDLKFL